MWFTPTARSERPAAQPDHASTISAVHTLTVSEPRVYLPADRPAVEVLVDESWCPGELRAWFPREDGWWANVAWSIAPGHTFLGTVPADHVRLPLAE